LEIKVMKAVLRAGFSLTSFLKESESISSTTASSATFAPATSENRISTNFEDTGTNGVTEIRGIRMTTYGQGTIRGVLLEEVEKTRDLTTLQHGGFPALLLLDLAGNDNKHLGLGFA
jgi:hypothetical protein